MSPRPTTPSVQDTCGRPGARFTRDCLPKGEQLPSVRRQTSSAGVWAGGKRAAKATAPRLGRQLYARVMAPVVYPACYMSGTQEQRDRVILGIKLYFLWRRLPTWSLRSKANWTSLGWPALSLSPPSARPVPSRPLVARQLEHTRPLFRALAESARPTAPAKGGLRTDRGRKGMSTSYISSRKRRPYE